LIQTGAGSHGHRFLRQGKAVAASALLLADRKQRVVHPLGFAVIERPNNITAACQE
jgi:hypothetical protein